jgi:hypothetical protein
MEHRGGVKKGAMMLAAVETVTNAHPSRLTRSGGRPDLTSPGDD